MSAEPELVVGALVSWQPERGRAYVHSGVVVEIHDSPPELPVEDSIAVVERRRNGRRERVEVPAPLLTVTASSYADYIAPARA